MRSPLAFFGTLAFLLIALTLLGLLSVRLGPQTPDLAYAVSEVRLPRYLLAVLLGAGLGLAGLAVQLATRNPLSEPELLGINQSAVFAVCLATLIWGKNLSTGGMLLVALSGGLLGGGAVLLLATSAQMTRDRLVLGGLTLAFFFGSVAHGMLLLRDSDLFELLHWTAGKLSGADWLDVRISGLALLVALAVALVRVSQWNLLELGDDSARGLGVDPVARRVELVAMTVGLCSVAVALAGPIGFVGLIVPHLARLLVGLDYLRVLPTTLLLGAVLVAGADLLARTVAQPVEIPAGVVTALVGAPYFLYRARKA